MLFQADRWCRCRTMGTAAVLLVTSWKPMVIDRKLRAPALPNLRITPVVLDRLALVLRQLRIPPERPRERFAALPCHRFLVADRRFFLTSPSCTGPKRIGLLGPVPLNISQTLDPRVPALRVGRDLGRRAEFVPTSGVEASSAGICA